mmetsp:Transcript_64683/g.200524  ORF Transcript_64683/g.200524 Transcript_64683/m.200524 type:complete len:277 (-) Transcript_64683:1209-2039(-)
MGGGACGPAPGRRRWLRQWSGRPRGDWPTAADAPPAGGGPGLGATAAIAAQGNRAGRACAGHPLAATLATPLTPECRLCGQRHQQPHELTATVVRLSTPVHGVAVARRRCLHAGRRAAGGQRGRGNGRARRRGAAGRRAGCRRRAAGLLAELAELAVPQQRTVSQSDVAERDNDLRAALAGDSPGRACWGDAAALWCDLPDPRHRRVVCPRQQEGYQDPFRHEDRHRPLRPELQGGAYPGLLVSQLARERCAQGRNAALRVQRAPGGRVGHLRSPR